MFLMLHVFNLQKDSLQKLLCGAFYSVCVPKDFALFFTIMKEKAVCLRVSQRLGL